MSLESVAASVKHHTYDCLPEKGQQFVRGSLYMTGGAVLALGMNLLYTTGTCRFYGKIPNCGNDPMLTVTINTVGIAAIYSCYRGAKESFQKAFS